MRENIKTPNMDTFQAVIYVYLGPFQISMLECFPKKSVRLLAGFRS